MFMSFATYYKTDFFLLKMPQQKGQSLNNVNIMKTIQGVSKVILENRSIYNKLMSWQPGKYHIIKNQNSTFFGSFMCGNLILFDIIQHKCSVRFNLFTISFLFVMSTFC